MLFNSLQFLIFFPIVTAGFFLLPHRSRWLWLLLASCYFYMAFIPAYILILAFTIVVDYFAGIWIENARGTRRKWNLGLSLAANVGILAIFKYYGFLAENIELALAAVGASYDIPPLDSYYDTVARAISAMVGMFGVSWESPPVHLLLPIGLSFHTFQAMSYTIEVYRGNQKAERHFGIFALYVMFYPQLVAGPIERPQNLLHQFHERHFFNYDRISAGLLLMAWGFFKKVVIADRLALIVNPVYNQPDEFHGLQVLVATYCFAIQIFCDFSGYSDIALGTAQVMGFTLMQNFRRPYHAASIVDFWRRWHISLSTWFRDYVYYPLGGNRGSAAVWYRNLLIVFMVSGLWHGAKWTFVLWGALHGVFMVLFVASEPSRERFWGRIRAVAPPLVYFRKPLAILITFHVVLLTWVFFRANSMHDAWTLLDHLFVADWWRHSLRPLGNPYEFVVAGVAVAALELAHVIEARREKEQPFFVWLPRPAWRRWGLSYALILAILLFGEFRNQEFIYFQF